MASTPIDTSTYSSAAVPSPRRQPSIAARIDAGLRAMRDPETVGVAPAALPAETTAPPMPTDEAWPSLNVVSDELRAMVDSQNERLKIIDTKANFGLAAASLLTAGVTGLGRALAEAPIGFTGPSWHLAGLSFSASGLVDLVTILALGTFALIALFTFLGYRIRTFREVANPRRLIDVYVYKPSDETVAALTNQRAKNFESNEAKLEQKASYINRAMALLVVQAALLIVIAIIQAFWL